MSLKCGIVGLPNVGKSTLFNALTKAGIQAENYPFCTIEPNVGIVEVPDARLGQLSAIVKPQRVQPAIVEFVDIAGLVAGASKGEGLGNQFLANIRETDAIVNVVRCFEDGNVVHVNVRVDPISDIETIGTEVELADLFTVEKTLNREQKKARAGDKDAQKLVAVLEALLPPMLILLAAYFAFSPRIADVDSPPRLSTRLFAPLVGGGLGVYGGFFGPGMGSIAAAAFAGLRGFNMRRATASTKPVVLITNFASMTVFVLGGHVVWSLVAAMAVAQIIGARLGAGLVINRGTALVRPVIVVTTMAIALRLMMK